MKVIRLHSINCFRTHDESIPQPGPGEVLVRIGSVGVCASDVHWYKEGRIGAIELRNPAILGHEAAGTVEALGQGVSGLRPGQKVALEPGIPCGTCEHCRIGNYNVCPEVLFMGVPPQDGALREYLTWPAKLAFPVPESMPLNNAAMLEPLGVGMHAVNISSIKAGSRIAVLGAGAIGLSVIQYARLKGCEILLASDPIKERREHAVKLGSNCSCSPCEAEDKVLELTGGKGADVVFECAGDSAAVTQSARLTRIMGEVVIVGIPDDDRYTFDAGASRRKQLRVVFSRRSNDTLGEAIELSSGGRINLSCFATHCFPLEKTDEAFKLAAGRKEGVIRAVINP